MGEDCVEPMHGRTGLCRAHYEQQQRQLAEGVRRVKFKRVRTPPGEGARVSVRFHSLDLEQVRAAAEAAGQDVAAWIRDACLRALK